LKKGKVCQAAGYLKRIEQLNGAEDGERDKDDKNEEGDEGWRKAEICQAAGYWKRVDLLETRELIFWKQAP
jgi:hypothetical protein